MDELPSAQFRRVYAKLPRTTLVTVNGHVIGKWVPMGLPSEVFIDPDGAARVVRQEDRFNSRPFTPVPKRRG